MIPTGFLQPPHRVSWKHLNHAHYIINLLLTPVLWFALEQIGIVITCLCYAKMFNEYMTLSREPKPWFGTSLGGYLGLWDVYVFCESVGDDLQKRWCFRRHSPLGSGGARLALLGSYWEASGNWEAFEMHREGILGAFRIHAEGIWDISGWVSGVSGTSVYFANRWVTICKNDDLKGIGKASWGLLWESCNLYLYLIKASNLEN